jgi:DNA-binding beta-propeller fold protein YncE
MRTLQLAVLSGIFFGLSTLGGDVSPTVPHYHVVREYKIPGDGSWDYISLDGTSRRLYVSHGRQLEVLNADTGQIIGQVSDTPGVHGVAIAPDLNRGFTSNGQDKSVTVFNALTLKPIKKVSVEGTDFILYDSFSKRVFPMNEKVTVLDGSTGDRVGDIELGGNPEAAVSDGKGKVYVNLADRNAVAVVDAKNLKVAATYPIDRCTSPHSLVYDESGERLFIGCREGLAVMDATNGVVVARTIMCSAVDAAAFDRKNNLIFESCAEGVISVIRQFSPNYYELVDTVKTQLWAKTMTFDPQTGTIFLPTAEFETVRNTDPKYPLPFKREIKPGTFTILVVTP